MEASVASPTSVVLHHDFVTGSPLHNGLPRLRRHHPWARLHMRRCEAGAQCPSTRSSLPLTVAARVALFLPPLISSLDPTTYCILSLRSRASLFITFTARVAPPPPMLTSSLDLVASCLLVGIRPPPPSSRGSNDIMVHRQPLCGDRVERIGRGTWRAVGERRGMGT